MYVLSSQVFSPTKGGVPTRQAADLRQMLVQKADEVSIRSSTDGMRRPHSVYLDLALPKKSASEMQLLPIPRRQSKENLAALLSSTAPAPGSLLDARTPGADAAAPQATPAPASGPSPPTGPPEGHRNRSQSITQLPADMTSAPATPAPPPEPLPDLNELIKGLDTDASFPNSYELEEKIVSSKVKYLRDLHSYLRSGRLAPVSTISLSPGAEQTVLLV